MVKNMQICRLIQRYKSFPRFSPVFVTLSYVKLNNLSSIYRYLSRYSTVLKTAVAQVTEGSNPSLSANNLQQFPVSVSGVSIPRFSPVFVMSFAGILAKFRM